MNQKIDHKPAFNWWVKAVLKNKLRIIPLFNKRTTRYLKKTNKFGIYLPKSVTQIYAQDKSIGNTLWEDAIAKYMKDVSPALRKLDNGDMVPIGYESVNCRMIFDVQMATISMG